jgi:hypothetical protein
MQKISACNIGNERGTHIMMTHIRSHIDPDRTVTDQRLVLALVAKPRGLNRVLPASLPEGHCNLNKI